MAVGSGTGRGGAKKPTFEPTNPSQDVARSCTLLRKNRGTTIWTRRNATARDNLTRAATLWSYLRIRRLGIRVPPSALNRVQLKGQASL